MKINWLKCFVCLVLILGLPLIVINVIEHDWVGTFANFFFVVCCLVIYQIIKGENNE